MTHGHRRPTSTPSRGRRIAKWVGIALGALLVLGLVGTALDYDPDAAPRDTAVPASSAPPAVVVESPAPALAPSSSAAAPAPKRAGVSEVVAAMSRLYPLPAPRDNTASCRAAGCVALTTTDAVSVYEWPDAASAQRWASGPVEGSAAGRFALTYASDAQQATSSEARAAWIGLVRERFAGR